MHNQSTSDASRLTQLINHAMGSVVIDMQPNVQQICNTLISARPDYLMLVNAQGQIRFASDACEDLVGIAGAALEDHTFDSLLVAEDRHSYQHFMNESVIPLAGSSFSKLGPLDLRVRIAGETKPEAFRWVALRIASVDLLRGSNQQHALFFFSLMDITHREQEEERILRQLNFDALTGLPSRYNIMSTVEKHIELSDEGAPFVFVFFDLDRFKTVNDALGHRIGDEFLSSICQRLNRWLDNAHIFARFGGDEFILFLPSMSDLEEAKALCLRALDLMREPMDVAGYTLSCGASFGLARYPDHGTTIDALIHAADTATYHTKSLGTGGCAVFDESMNAERFSQIELEQEMREALAQQAFLAFYQPCVDLVTGEIVAVEALARWQHKRRGLLNPTTFWPWPIRQAWWQKSMHRYNSQRCNKRLLGVTRDLTCCYPLTVPQCKLRAQTSCQKLSPCALRLAIHSSGCSLKLLSKHWFVRWSLLLQIFRACAPRVSGWPLMTLAWAIHRLPTCVSFQSMCSKLTGPLSKTYRPLRRRELA